MHLNVPARRLYLLIALSAGLASIAAAQAPGNRLFVSVGGGYGHSGPSNSTGLDQFSGPAGDVIVGAAMTSRGVIGVDVAGWHKDTPLGPSRSVFVSLSLLGYPFGSFLDNLYFQGGLGIGNASFPTLATTQTPSRLDFSRPSLQIALGYDIPIACPVFITPFFQSYGTFGGRRFTGATSPNEHGSANGVLFFGGVSLRFSHPGPAGNCGSRSGALIGQQEADRAWITRARR